MMLATIEYDENGIFIPFHVSKENPCPFCGAVVDKAHANYCPNNRIMKSEGD